ncbi:MAG: GGDEF domain-containing protein [Motiliproteus sp.]
MNIRANQPVDLTPSSPPEQERRGNPELINQINQQRSHEQQHANKKAFAQRLAQEYFFDILRARSHSKHFRHTRALYLSNRVRSLACILALLIPAWIAVDAFYLPSEELKIIAILRILTGLSCLGLALWSHDSHDLKTSRFKLALLILIPSLFHTATQVYLISSGNDTLPAGYHFFPFLIISLGSIFPLTIFEGGFIAAFVMGLYTTTELAIGDLFALQSLNDIWLLGLLAVIAGWAALTQLSMMMRLYRQAHRDPLTGLANRRSIMDFLRREVEYSRSIDAPLSVILLDLDKFKRINDNHGHAVGDQVLCGFADMLIAQSRPQDLVGRFGGEEFLIILSATSRDSAQLIAERLRQNCHQQAHTLDQGSILKYTTSAGVTQLRPSETIEEMIKRADDALYDAKGCGRDRVIVA